MRRSGYQLLGYAVWRGVKWYVRTRLGFVRKVAVAGGLAALLLAVAAVALRRNGDQTS